MDRRDFLVITGAGAALIAVPGVHSADVSGLSDAGIEKRVKKLLSEMTLDEKVGQMTAEIKWRNIEFIMSPAIERLGIPEIKFTDGPRGVLLNRSTCFPSAMARGAAWDVELEERVGSTMGYEARAQGASLSGAVCINLLRHPGWGRAQETFGEDPYHLGRMGAGLTKGLKGHVMVCAKHFAANSIENSRFYVDVRMDERTLREIYLPHFKMCVDAGIASVMTAYNDLNGHLCGHNSHLLRDILKGDWKFDGYVISDAALAVEDTVAAANAGLDIEMPRARYYGRKLKKAVEEGNVSGQVIDEAVTRILRHKLRFARDDVPERYDAGRVACPGHTALAREVAQKSMVLLKNDNSALPINREKLETIAVIGELADRPNTGDRGSSMVRPPYVITPLQGIRNRAGNSVNIVYNSGRNLWAARKTAREADAAVVVAGLTWKDEGEYIFLIGGDRKDLGLSGKQVDLINAVAEENTRCIVVLEGGSAITMESWKDKVQAIIMAWYPGMEGGNAIADILFGDVNPCGKLPVTFPGSTEQLPRFDTKAKTIEYGYYHGYRLFDKKGYEPAYPFGFGLSYTEYKYSNLRLNRKKVGRSGKVKVMVDVTNTGKMAGEEIVQLYVGYKGSGVDRPLKDLKGFGKLALKSGETKTMTIDVKASDLAFYNTDRGEWEIEEIEYFVYAGPSSRREDLLKDTFKISGY